MVTWLTPSVVQDMITQVPPNPSGTPNPSRTTRSCRCRCFCPFRPAALSRQCAIIWPAATCTLPDPSKKFHTQIQQFRIGDGIPLTISPAHSFQPNPRQSQCLWGRILQCSRGRKHSWNKTHVVSMYITCIQPLHCIYSWVLYHIAMIQRVEWKWTTATETHATIQYVSTYPSMNVLVWLSA